MARAHVGKEVRWLRMGAGVLCMVCGLILLKKALPGSLVTISGCITFLTGLVRWSPLRAMTARTIRSS